MGPGVRSRGGERAEGPGPIKPNPIQKTYPLARARVLAIELQELLRGACHQIEVAGSVRRGSGAQVHDIDLVAWPLYSDTVATNLFGEVSRIYGAAERLLERLRIIGADPGTPPIEAKILRCQYQNLPVEIYLSEHDGSNFGALLQMRTGSAMFNTLLAARAHNLGLAYRAGYGIFRGDVRVDDGTEAGVFEALGLEYMLPALRSGAKMPNLLQGAETK
jgi:DNA polymerase/3'-5' exonuclease PolX